MPVNEVPRCRVALTRVDEFLRDPPAGFSVEVVPSGHRVHSDPERSLVLIDDFDSCGGTVVFYNSAGRKVKTRNLWEYTGTRTSLLSKRIYLLVSAQVAPGDARAAPQQYVLSIDGSDPFIRSQMERGLDRTISSVAGESYRVDVDFTELLETWAAQNLHALTDETRNVTPAWRDATFTLKYCSDALFDFPYWFGFSKRTFKLRMTWASSR